MSSFRNDQNKSQILIISGSKLNREILRDKKKIKIFWVTQRASIALRKVDCHEFRYQCIKFCISEFHQSQIILQAQINLH